MALRPIEEPQPIPPLVDGRNRPIGAELRRALNRTLGNHGESLKQLALDEVIFLVPYGAVVTPDLSQGANQKVVISDGNAFTIAAPKNPTGLAHWLLVIVNGTSGALGAVTFSASIVQKGFVAPAAGQRTSAFFLMEGTTHYQVTPWL